MACKDFDGQVVRLERIKEVADRFVRVRLTRIDPLDLNLFEFDYDLTFMVFFLDTEENVYARYGGRDAENPDRRQSLAGLRYTMESVLRMHSREQKAYAAKAQEKPRLLRDIAGTQRGGRCLHCHQVKEILNADAQKAVAKSSRDLAWRYPLPDNLGLSLDVDRGNVVKEVKKKSPASRAGLEPGDILQRLNGVPIHSFADGQLALDRAPATGSIDVVWQRGDEIRKERLWLSEGWRKTDITWRPSVQRLVPSARLYGADLTDAEKKALGLSAAQLAFRQQSLVPSQAQTAGVRAGDIILGVDGQALEMDVIAFLRYVNRNYLVGDPVTVNLLRDGKRMDLKMTLR